MTGARAHDFCHQFNHCCDSECFTDCSSRPGADPACRPGHRFTHNLDDADFCIGVGCISSSGSCEPDIASGTTVPCTRNIRSCAGQMGNVLCADPPTPDPMGTNNKCLTVNEPNPNIPNYDFCPKFACRGGIINNVDTDQDGLFDCWENEGGIDANGDGTLDWALPAVSATHRDVIVEFDWFDCAVPGSDCVPGDMHSHQPNGLLPNGLNVLANAVFVFLADPELNPDGNPGTNLWLLPGEALPHQNVCGFDATCFDLVKSVNFGTPAERMMGVNTIMAKRVAARYAVWTHNLAPNDPTSGLAGLGGANFVVSLGEWARTPQEQLGTFIHELGHTLGLQHGGNDDAGNKPNYFSVMNYNWQIDGVDQPPNRFWTYSTVQVPTLDELNLSEPIGAQGGMFNTRWSCPNGELRFGPAAGALNWDCVEVAPPGGGMPVPVPTAVGVQQDVNGDRICATSGLNGIVDTPVLPNDIVARGAIYPGNNSILNSVTAPLSDDVVLVTAAPWVFAGMTGVVETVPAPLSDDKFVPALNAILPGRDGILQTTMTAMDDIIAPATFIAPGNDGFVQSVAAMDDILRYAEVWDGADRICQSTPAMDDRPWTGRNGTPVNSPQPRLLNGHADWAHLSFDFTPNLVGFNAGTAMPIENEMDLALAERIRERNTFADLSILQNSVRNTDGSITFTIEVDNTGPDAAPNATVNLQLPSGVSVVSCTSTQGSCSNSAGRLLVAIGNLVPGSGATVTLKVNVSGTPAAGTQLDPSIDASSTDPLRGNNRSPICLLPPTFGGALATVNLTTCTGVTLPPPSLSSLCGLAITTTNDAPAKFPLGTTTVTWTATDAQGNKSTATQQVVATLADDATCCPTGTNVILGNQFPNILFGTNNADCILGMGGLDTISGLGGNDFISGGASNDFLHGDSGNDTIFGGAGADQIFGDDGTDTLYGEADNDVISGGFGDDALVGGPGFDICNDFPGNDTESTCEL